ncbi:helix-turn-helix domain-containing protein [Microtetraspora sp. AC03309]|uniref:helix-turn-helix domain-containing protein n=1 Tax=Microtetraspora sp. AC03309 TaxID=2779376 RepID=UPI001E5805FE|nr:helix-turn-helix domain-containing protein [Microtetraspora sp. AC03309]MCC5574571.1 helix-turn-helix domain-containing protein [Microtetraspora sp. AC03309]
MTASHAPMLNKDALAALLGCAPKTVARKAKTGEWPSHSPAGAYMFTEDDVAEIFELTRTKPQAPKAEQPSAPAPAAPKPRTRLADRVVRPLPGSNVAPLVPKPVTRRRSA